LDVYRSLREIRNALDHNHATCRTVVERYLRNIGNKAHLNAFLEVFADEALIRADEIDRKRKAGTAGRLAGMVIGLKDLLCYQDHRIQASSRILDGFVSQYSATAVQRILDEDAIIIGRLNCDEFGMGSSNENSAYGPVRNPLDHGRVPGGSSGGSAAAVRANLCTASLGSDTGGSVRQPASFCGLVGMKPTYSRISRHGLIAYASSFDVIGILSNTVEDNALLLEVMAGADEYDSTVSRTEVPAYSRSLSDRQKARIGYLREALDGEGLDDTVAANLQASLKALRDAGHQVEEVSFPLLKYSLPTYYILITAEASSNLARYDGVRYGYRSADAPTVEAMYKNSRSEGFGAEVKRRIMLGTFVLSSSYYDAYYTRAQKVRRLIRDQTRDLFRRYDFLILPTTPTTAFNLGERSQDPLSMYLADLFTVQASVAGVPAISLPNGTDHHGMPFGLQVMADFFQEQKLYAFADHYLNEVADAVA
jgi:aspartyl-tRNA(Asn)/glutamyl-tRNA(Gln) amidotransferase subunit A